ncbi:hypothetical protein ACFL6W_10710 [Thermodesulfobacteriota bacterium]
MTIRIFYSWQSDISNKINRNFIEDAIKKSINELSTEIQIDNAQRDEEFLFDKDTKGTPGIPPIADTIFKKISECTIFIPDLTFVGKTKKGRLMPNPNVLIEYGWALKEVGHGRMIPLMNSAFGEPSYDSLPFDMRHLRYPLSYYLPEDSNIDVRKKQKIELIKNLKSSIKLIMESGSIDNVSEPNNSQEISSTYKPSLFTEEYETMPRAGRFNEMENLYIPEVQHLFLRLIPLAPVAPIKSSKEALDLVRAGNLRPMSEGTIGWASGRNKYGAYSFSNEEAKILHLSQLFKNKEVWGIDSFCVDKDRLMKRSNVNFGFIPCVDFEQTYYQTLKNYLSFAQDTLNLPVPLKLIAGVTDVEGYRMTPPPGMNFGGFNRFNGNVVDEHLIFEGKIQSYEEDSSAILIPFFEYVWDECGLERPDKAVFR